LIAFFKKKISSNKNRTLVSNFISLLLLQGANYILPMLTVPYLFRVLGAEKFGLISFASSIILLLKVISEYGFNLSGTRDVANNANNKEKLIEIFSSIMLVKFYLILFVLVVLTILIFSFDNLEKEYLLFYITFGVVVGEALFPKWFFQGMEQMKYITYINIGVKVFFTFCVFIFVHNENDYYIVPLLTSLGTILAGIISIILIYSMFGISFVKQNRQILLKYFKESWNIFLTEFMPNLYNNFSTILLGFLVNMQDVGYYSLATRVIGIFNSLLQVLKTVTYPYLNKDFSKFKIITKIIVGTGFILSFILFVFSSFFMPLIFGTSSIESLNLIYILALSPLFTSILFAFGTNKLLILRKDKDFRNISFQFSIFGFILSLIFVPIYGIYGAAVTLILTRALMAYLVFKKSASINV
jgi:PST family polysaccharide transporter